MGISKTVQLSCVLQINHSSETDERCGQGRQDGHDDSQKKKRPKVGVIRHCNGQGITSAGKNVDSYYNDVEDDDDDDDDDNDEDDDDYYN